MSTTGSASTGSVADVSRTPRWMDRIADLMGLRLVAWVTLVLFGFPQVAERVHLLGFHHDQRFFYHHEDVTRTTIARFHQLPAWNPYFCGGVPHIANPQDASLSPDVLLRLWLGVEPGRRAAVILFLVLGLEGVYRLARSRDSSPAGSAFAAVAFALCGWVTSVVTPGWVNMLGIDLLPWAVLGLERSLRDTRWVLLGGAAVAWMFLCAGTYTTPFAVLALTAVAADLTVRLALEPARARAAKPWRPWYCLALLGAVAAALAAGKLLPTLAVVVHYPRVWEGTEINHASNLLDALTDGVDDPPINMHVGRAAVILALAGAALGPRRTARDAPLALLFFVFAMGSFGDWAPFTLLQKLPVFGQLRSPHRLLVLCAFFVALGAGRTITLIEDGTAAALRAFARWAESRTPDRPWPRAAHSLVAFAGGLLGFAIVAAVFWPVARDVVTDNHLQPSVYRIDPPAVVPDETFHQARGNRWHADVWVPAQRGSLHCLEETPFPESAALRGSLDAEEYPQDPSAATVTRVSWSPNEIVLRVHANRATQILVNQNYASAWRSNVGEVRSENGLLAVRVPPGDNTVVLRYRDRLLLAAVAISALALIALIAFLARECVRSARNLVKRWRELPDL